MKTNKEKDNKKLMIQKILERVQMNGWERGKKQCKTPYDFTLADETFLIEQFYQICQLIPEEGIVIAELREENKRLKETHKIKTEIIENNLRKI